MRSRYLDLIVRERRAVTRCVARAKVNASLRATFADHDFLEVETPMLQVQHGGAAARPFVTHAERVRRRCSSCASRPSCSSSAPSSAASTASSRSTATSATRAPTRRTAPSSRCSRRTRRTATTHGIADLTQELIQNAAAAVVRARTTVTWADGTEYDLGGQWDAHLDVRLAVGGIRERRSPPRRRLERAGGAARTALGVPSRSTHARQVRRGAVGALREGRTHPTHAS